MLSSGVSSATSVAHSYALESDTLSPLQGTRRATEIFGSALSAATTYYVDSTASTQAMKLGERGIRSMLSGLDPYTEFITEEDRADFEVMTTGAYAGIGAYIQKVDSIVYIRYPMEGSPARAAGLQIGDAILEIDGERVVPGTPSEVSSRLKGPIGTTVQVKVLPLGAKRPKTVSITRDNVMIDQVVSSGIYRDSIGYIRLSGFTVHSAEDVRRAFDQLTKQSKGKLSSLILDLRSNGGGILDGAIDILGMFVPKGTKVLYTKGRLPETSKEYYTETEPIAPNMPLAVLINGSSASSSEILAGALQDLDRAVLIGTKSFGKGLVQTTLPLPYNTILKVTISRYYIPSGRCIQQLDYSHRNPDGTVAAVPDSLTTTFYTANGRAVKDGGGIRPDIEVEGESMDAIAFSMVNEGKLFSFANQLYLERAKPKTLSDVVITDNDLDRLVDQLEASGLDYGENSRDALEALERVAKWEGYTSEETTAAIAHLKKLITPSLRRDFAPSREQVRRLLRGQLATHYFGQKGEYRVTLETDPTFQKALDLLSSPEEQAKILQPEGQKSVATSSPKK